MIFYINLLIFICINLYFLLVKDSSIFSIACLSLNMSTLYTNTMCHICDLNIDKSSIQLNELIN